MYTFTVMNQGDYRNYDNNVIFGVIFDVGPTEEEKQNWKTTITLTWNYKFVQYMCIKIKQQQLQKFKIKFLFVDGLEASFCVNVAVCFDMFVIFTAFAGLFMLLSNSNIHWNRFTKVRQ